MKICKQMWSCSITLACFCISSSEVQWWSWDLLFFFWIDLISLVFKYSDFFFLHLRIIYLCYSFICNPFFPWYHQSRISFSFHFSLKQLLLSVRIADHRDIKHRTSTDAKHNWNFGTFISLSSAFSYVLHCDTPPQSHRTSCEWIAHSFCGAGKKYHG